tara:strand:+ start:6348 stop:6827 length:480 start_codon:yes stop_codon:yes gene_type:complete
MNLSHDETFKLIIAGTRLFPDYFDHEQTAFELLRDKTDDLLVNKFETHNIEFVSGCATGADRLGERYAHELQDTIHPAEKSVISLKQFPADWNKYGNSAGYKRNEEMGKYADALLAYWDGASRGTMHMINIMRELNKPVRVVRYTAVCNDLYPPNKRVA